MKKTLFFALSLALIGCGKHSDWDWNDFADEMSGNLRTGWLAGTEDFSQIPHDITFFAGSASDLPSAVSLESKFPPIGDQGQYGTCIAWATGYNLKTALNGMDKGWSGTDLAKTANQTSPKDLWMAIPATKKAASCEGTNFEYALDALVSKGAASLSEVPYSNMGSCSGTSDGNENNKLANYRKIAYNDRLQGGKKTDGMDVSNFKGYLAQGRPVIIGARLGDRFMKWNSSSVISSDTYNDPGMMHAYHAMILSGYDDSKNAFRVRNTWGTSWGNGGSIWVDYDFFLNDFCFAAFVAQNPPAPALSADDLLSDYDLLASFAEDIPNSEGTSPRHRGVSYDVFNNGSSTIYAKEHHWSVFYMYYNAYDANEYKIILEDYYTNEYGEYGKWGEYKHTVAFDGGLWNNMDVAPGKKAGEAEFGPKGFYIDYTMPEITGDYYLVVYADAYDDIQETNEDNNFYFIAAENGKPLHFEKGVMQSKPANTAAKALGKKLAGAMHAPAASVAELGELNAYTPQEIKSLLKRDKKNGVLAKKITEFRESGSATVKIPRKR